MLPYFVQLRPQWISDGKNVGGQDAVLGRGEVSQNVLLVVETFMEIGWEA